MVFVGLCSYFDENLLCIYVHGDGLWTVVYKQWFVKNYDGYYFNDMWIFMFNGRLFCYVL